MPKKKGKNKMEAKAEQAKTASKIIIDRIFDRKKLTEARKSGVSFAFVKMIAENKFQHVSPLSACKDYLNDLPAARILGETVSAYGFSCKPSDYLDGKTVRLHATSLYDPYYVSCSGLKSDINQETGERIRAMSESLAIFGLGLSKMIPAIKEPVFNSIKVDDGVILEFDSWWAKATYRISAISLFLRVAIDSNYDGKSDPIKWMEKHKTDDWGYTVTALDNFTSIIKMCNEDQPSKNKNGLYNKYEYWHSFGCTRWHPVHNPIPG